MTRERSQTPASPTEPGLPRPGGRAQWRWSAPRRAVVAGGVLAAVLSLASVSAGAATTPGAPPSGAGAHGKPPSGLTKPTAAGMVTALADGVITMKGSGQPAVTVDYASSTTFRTMSGSSSASALKVGDFISVVGTKSSTGTVTAKSIMIGAPPGKMGRGPGGRPSGNGVAPHHTTPAGA